MLMISDDEGASAQKASRGPIHPQNMLAQVANELRVEMAINEFGTKDDKFFKQTLDKAQKWKKQYSSPQDIPDSDIPEAYDFRNIDGYDFTGPVRDQGKCGSCYTVAFVQAVEARLKLKYGK
jgi:C1A family cysteine protease